MSNEASKTKLLWGEFEHKILSGKGIDIGCGSDPITESVKRFEIEDGDANEITRYIHEDFDFVFSCHVLEHMNNPEKALKEWWALVKPGGYLIFIVPDEDLYEQGYFPSVFNRHHNATFTISKEKSWSPNSYNLLDLVKCLKNGSLAKIQLQDRGYNRNFLNHSRYSGEVARVGGRLTRKLAHVSKMFGLSEHFLRNLFRLPIDQTSGDAVAQIEVIVKKYANCV